MNNFYKIFKLIREDEEQERVNLDKFVKKQLKKNRNIITDEIMTMKKIVLMNFEGNIGKIFKNNYIISLI